MSEVRRDILLAIRSEFNQSGFSQANTALSALEKRINDLNSKLKISIGFAGISGADSELSRLAGVVKSASGAARSGEADFKRFSEALLAQEKRAGAVTEKVREYQKTLASGKQRTTSVFEGGGVSASFTRETGASTVGIDFRKTPQGELSKAQDAAIREDIIRERKRATQLRESQEEAATKARVDALRVVNQDNAIRDAAAKDDVIREKTRQAKLAEAHEAGLRESVTRAKREVRERNAIRAEADREDQTRSRNRRSFEEVASQPGVTTKAGPVRVTESGALVRDTSILDERGRLLGRMNAETGRLTLSQRDLNKEVGKSGDSFQNAAGKVLLWTLATGAVIGTLGAIRNGITVFAQAEQDTIRLERVGRGFGASQDEIRQKSAQVTEEILRLKSSFGQSGSEAADAAVVFARLGLSANETLLAVRTSMLAANVAGIGAADAAKLLASAMSQFQLSARDLPDLLNKLNTLENTTRITTNDLLQSISRTGGVFREAGGSFEQLSAITAIVGQTTGRTGAEIGNALKTIATRLGETSVQAKVFQRSGVVIAGLSGQLKPIDQILADLVVRFQSLSDAEKAEITTSVAGARQRNILQSALDNYFQVQGSVIRQLQSAGSAEEENALVLGTLSSKVNQLLAAFEQLAVTIGNSGLGAALKGIIGFLTTLVRGFAEFGTAGGVAFTLLGTIIAGLVLKSVLSASFAFLGLASSVRNASNATLQFVAVQSAAQANALKGVGSNAALAASYIAVGRAAQTAAAGAGAAGAAATGAGLLARAAAALTGPIGIAVTALSIAATAGAFFLGNNSQASQEDRINDDDIRAGSKVKLAENQVKGAEESIRFAQNAQRTLQAIEDQEAKGVQVSKSNLDTKRQIYQNITQLFGLTTSEIEKANAAELKSADITAIVERAKRKEIEETENLRKALQEKALVAARQQIGEVEKLAALKINRKNLLSARDDAAAAEDGSGGGLFLAGIQSQLADLDKQIAASEARLAGFREKTNESLKEATKPQEDKDAELKFQTLKAFKRELSDLEKQAKIKFLIDTELAEKSTDRVNAELAQTISLLHSLENRKETIPIAAVEQREEIEGEIEKLGDKANELLARRTLEGMRDSIKKARDIFSNEFKRGLSLRDELTNLSVSGGPEINKDIRQAEARIKAERDTVTALEAALTKSRQAPDNEGAGDRANRVSRAAEIENQLLQARERLQDKVVDKTQAQLRTMQRIGEEQRRQLDSTRKELAGLSDEELLKTRILASRVQSGQQKPFSQEQFLNLDQGTRGLVSRFDNLFPGRQLTPDLRLGFENSAFLKQERPPLEDPAFEAFRAKATSTIDQPLQAVLGQDSRIIQAERVILQNNGAAPRGDEPPEAARAVAQPPAGALNIAVKLDGVEVPLDRITSALSVLVVQEMQKYMSNSVQKVERTIKSNAPVRSR